jgi:hypothetical protein
MQEKFTTYRVVKIICKGGSVQMSGTKINESKFYSGRNYEQTEVRECLLSFGAEYFVFQFAIQT